MEKKYDIIIVGSGMGGLTSSIILAKEGYSVCLIEKNNQYGGNLQTFVKERTIFDTGVHYLGALDKGQNLYQYFKYLGIIDHLQLSRMDEDAYDYVTFDGDPNKYPHAQGYENFVQQLKVFFPEEEDVIRQYCNDIQKICNRFPLYYVEAGSPYDKSTLSYNTKEYIDKLTDNEKLKAVLMGSNPLYGGNADTPLYVHALTINSYIESSWRVLRGGSQISKIAIRELRKYGGDIYKNEEVNELIFEENKLLGVKTSKGDTYYGEQFVFNIDLNRVIELVGENRFRKSFCKRIERLEVTPSSFSIYIVFKPNSFPYLNHNIYNFSSTKNIWDATDYNPETWPDVYMASMGIDEKNQKFAKSMSVMTYMHFEEVEEWEHTFNTVRNVNDRGSTYHDFKKRKIQQLLDRMESQFPNLQDHIQSVYATTPLTYRDYIGGKKGNMYGFKKFSNNPLITFFSPRTKIPNLFLTGQNVNMHGILGTTIGAVNTCGEILGRDYLLKKIKNEVNK